MVKPRPDTVLGVILVKSVLGHDNQMLCNAKCSHSNLPYFANNIVHISACSADVTYEWVERKNLDFGTISASVMNSHRLIACERDAKHFQFDTCHQVHQVTRNATCTCEIAIVVVGSFEFTNTICKCMSNEG